MSVALCEAGANIYVVDIAPNPSETFLAAQKYVEALGQKLHYVQGDVTNQKEMWDIGEKIGDAEGRLDVCVAAAGILRASPVRPFALPSLCGHNLTCKPSSGSRIPHRGVRQDHPNQVGGGSHYL